MDREKYSSTDTQNITPHLTSGFKTQITRRAMIFKLHFSIALFNNCCIIIKNIKKSSLLILNFWPYYEFNFLFTNDSFTGESQDFSETMRRPYTLLALILPGIPLCMK